MKTALLTLVFATSLHAQMAETIEVRITNVDVVVTDRSGKPVYGLTKDDFEVFEAGKPQPITNFYEIRGDAPASPEVVPSSPEAPAVPEDVSRRRIVIFVDNYSIHPFARNQAFASLEKSLDELMRPGDEALLVFWYRRQEILGPFTSDRAELVRRFREATKRAASGMNLVADRQMIIERASRRLVDSTTSRRGKSVHMAYVDSIAEARAFAEQMYALETDLIASIKSTLATLAGLEGKKAMIYLGSELPDNPALDVFQQIDGMYQSHVKIMQPPQIREQGRTLARELRSIAREANANAVTMYMIDTADRNDRGDPSMYMLDPSATFISQTNTPLAMATIASLTGGLSVPGGRNFEAALDTIVADLSSYYSLGYRSPEGEGDRRITVKVKREGLRVRARSSYIAKDGDADVRDRVIANVFHPGVKSDFPVSVAVGKPERHSRGRYKLPVTVSLPSTLTLIPQDDTLAGEFAVYIATGREEGALSEISKAVQPMKFPASAVEALRAQGTFTYAATLLVREGEQVISVGVTDTLAGTVGFARARVVVR